MTAEYPSHQTSLQADILDLAIQKDVTLITAESCTAGLISAALTDLAGSSQIFDRGYVTYSNDAKMELLHVQAETLQQFGAVSEEIAKEMVMGCVKNDTGSSDIIALSVTGIAGPGGTETKPEGRVCFGLASKRHGADLEISTYTEEFGALGRASVREASVLKALELIENTLKK